MVSEGRRRVRPLADVASAAKRMKREHKRGIVIGGALILIFAEKCGNRRSLGLKVKDTELTKNWACYAVELIGIT